MSSAKPKRPMRKSVLGGLVVKDANGVRWRVCLECGHRVRVRDPLRRPRSRRRYGHDGTKTDQAFDTIQRQFIGDGARDTFTLDLPIDGPMGHCPVGYGYVTYDDAPESLGSVGFGLAWEYDPATRQLKRTLGPPAHGSVTQIVFETLRPVPL